MKVRRRDEQRSGVALPLVVVSLVALLTCTALAVDVGMVAVAKTQCQAAADSAALAGARTLNGARISRTSTVGTGDNNYAAAAPAIVATATANRVLGQTVSSADVTAIVGKYYYQSSQAKFVAYPVDPGSVNDNQANWSLANATVRHSGPASFGASLGLGGFSTQASATAVHRPRDVSLVLDFSGSMRFGSLLGTPYSGPRGSNNPDPNYPKFGHYSDTSAADLRQNVSSQTISGNSYEATNTTASNALNSNRLPIADDFYATTGNSPVRAFTSAGAGDSEGFVSGDRPLLKNLNGYLGGGTYAKTLREAVSNPYYNDDTSVGFFENGYSGYYGYDFMYWLSGDPPFQGFTRGPSHWGKTFFIWPPDSRGATSTSTSNQHDNGAKDWRQRFFLKTNGSTPVDDNNLLWQSDGDWRPPNESGTDRYKINYRAVLHWIKNVGPNPFPTKLQAGRILYYSKIPDPNDTNLNTRFWNQFPLSDPDERFWKDYIDYVLGHSQYGTSNWLTESSSQPNLPQLRPLRRDLQLGVREGLRQAVRPLHGPG